VKSLKTFIEDTKKMVSERLEKITNDFSYSNVLRESIRYTLLNSGKMFRPVLLMVVLHDFHVDDVETGVEAACAIEMFHNYALIHDDLPAMDNDRHRRGILCNHLVFGEAQAILAGDALQAEAFKVLAMMKLKDSVKVDIISLIADLMGANGLVGGQSLDIISAHEERENLDAERLNKIHFGKTGAMIEASILTAGLIGNAPAEALEKLRVASYNIGLAFQIRDDIYDLVLTNEQLGKDPKSDLKNDKLTYPKIYGLEKSKMMLEDHTKAALTLLEELFGQESFTYRYIQEGLK
jgi:geranylgeranyl diphosphate synthase type II